MLHLRHGRKDDLPAVLDLIKELAAYEKALNKVENTVKMMEKDGFGKNRVFDFIVADNDSKILGAAIYYFRYSTWKGQHHGAKTAAAVFTECFRNVRRHSWANVRVETSIEENPSTARESERARERESDRARERVSERARERESERARERETEKARERSSV